MAHDVAQQEIWDRPAAGESVRSIARSIHKGQATVRDLIAESSGSEIWLSLVKREEISNTTMRLCIS